MDSLNKKLVRKQNLEQLINIMKESYGLVDEKLVDFISLLDQHGFFLNLQTYDIEYFLEDYKERGSISLPTLKTKGICIGTDGIYSGKTRFGIDPSFCFNKTGDCSIIAHFPMSKREYKRFIVFFEKLLSESGNKNLKKEWFNSASTCWYGAFTTFGE